MYPWDQPRPRKDTAIPKYTRLKNKIKQHPQQCNCQVGSLALDQESTRLQQPCSKDIMIFSTETFECLQTLTGHVGTVLRQALDKESKRLQSCSHKGRIDGIKVWNTDTFECLNTMTKHDGNVMALALDKESKRLYSCAEDSFMIWSTETFECLKKIETYPWLTELVLDKESKKIQSCTVNGQIKVQSTETQDCLNNIKIGGEIKAISYSFD